MSTEGQPPQDPEPVDISAQFIVEVVPMLRATVTVIPADAVEVEKSTTLKYLRLRNADYTCYTSVYLVLDGERHEITMDTLPDEPKED